MVTIASLNLANFLTTAQSCTAKELYKYHQKITGGIKCSDTEQIKLNLGVYLLEVYQSQGLTCLEDVVDTEQRTLLHLLKTDITEFCRNCITPVAETTTSDSPKALPTGAAITTDTGVYLVTETGDYIITN